MSELEQWGNFHSRFLDLANEEQELVQHFIAATGRQDEQYIYAYRAPESGQWKFGGGLGAELRERVRTAATHAAIALGFQEGTDPEDSWLRQLYSHLRENENAYHFKHLFEQHLCDPSMSLVPTVALEGGAILRVCTASATLCSISHSRLERQAAASSTAAAPSSTQNGDKTRKQRRERGPDYETSRQRVALEDDLRRELGTIKSRAEKFATVNDLQKEFPNFRLWKILSQIEQQQLLTEEFKPTAYARILVMRAYGLTNGETIKKDRQKLRKAK